MPAAAVGLADASGGLIEGIRNDRRRCDALVPGPSRVARSACLWGESALNGTVVLLIVNTAVAGLFAVSYVLIAVVGRGQRPVIAFGISYFIGMLTPLCELAIHWGAPLEPLMVLSPLTLLVAFLVMSAALSAFERRRPYWGAIAAIGLVGTALRMSIWTAERNHLAYELGYQAPFVAALGLCAWTAIAQSARRPLQLLLGTLFAVIAMDFLLKPFVAVSVGSGASPRGYVASAYALFSQASTGILLIAAGLVVLVVVVQALVQDFTLTTETDPLSGLLNRRGFERQAQQILAAAARNGRDITAVMIDFDHFKRINDTYGHDVGDGVIRHFAAVLNHVLPRCALVARMGGEEFAVLLDDTTLAGGQLIAETVRHQLRSQPCALPRVTVSLGVAQRWPDEALGELLRRADQAAYRAKQAGRDRVVCDAPGSNVVDLRGGLGGRSAG